jgi:hypothetical protein
MVMMMGVWILSRRWTTVIVTIGRSSPTFLILMVAISRLRPTIAMPSRRLVLCVPVVEHLWLYAVAVYSLSLACGGRRVGRSRS